MVTEELSGSGGGILDFETFESSISIIYDAVGQPDQLAWAYQPAKVTLRGLSHTNLRDLSISLIHREPNREDTVWDLASCGTDLSGDGAALVLSGNYQFIAPTDPNQQTFLENKTICQVAEAGGIGGVLVPSGRYRPEVSLTSQMTRRQLGGEWILQIIDTGNGATGALAGWDLELVTFPFDQDCNGDGEPDICTNDDAQFGTGDCNGNGISDQCEIANDPTLDCNLNARLDVCEDLGFFDDCDEDDVIDICQIAADPSLDSNNNFILDACEDLGDDCEIRQYESLARVNSGPGANFVDLSMVASTLFIESEEDTDGSGGDNSEVHPGSLITGGVEVTVAGLEHENLNEIALRLTHTAPNGLSVTVPLIAIGCSGQGFLGDTGDIIFRDLGPQKTICDQATTPGPIPAGDYLPESSLFGFFGMPVAGEWALELYDIGNGATGSIDSWDISFSFSPPDNDFNGVPDICEP